MGTRRGAPAAMSFPVVHGWNADETEACLDMVDDPDRAAAASYLTANEAHAGGSLSIAEA
ncbi:MAG: hypothetical protein JRN58_10495 [Nitrososphaerota archaeon]|nr:hypothetical protein [Nitrososphaerota archaeon]